MNRWLQGLIVAAGFSLLLLPQAALADHETDHTAQGIRDTVEGDVDALKDLDPEERAGTATRIHEGVLGKVEGLVPDEAKEEGKGINRAQTESYNPLGRAYEGPRGGSSRPSVPFRGGYRR